MGVAIVSAVDGGPRDARSASSAAHAAGHVQSVRNS